ncbi:MAG: GntR family transcriptional regulator, partial [Chloroflexota bacterium]
MKKRLSAIQAPKTSSVRSAAQLEQLLEARICEGVYPIGARLPTVRASADEWRVDKSTVARAYKSLERKGYLELTRGRGAFVVQREPQRAGVDSRWLQRLAQLVTDAQRQALGRDVVLREVTQAVERVYRTASHRFAFVECNMPDVQVLVGQLSAAMARPLEGLLLEDVLARPAAIVAQYDLVVTTFYHLGEAQQALGAAAKDKIVGVHSTPTHEALLRIARLQAMVIGFVYELPRVADEFVHTIKSYHPTATILPVPIGDTARLRSLFAKADAIIVTQMCHARLMALQPPVPVILVSMTIDQQSIDFLRSKIAETE